MTYEQYKKIWDEGYRAGLQEGMKLGPLSGLILIGFGFMGGLFIGMLGH